MYEWLRKKSDAEISDWLKNTVGTKMPFCTKCGIVPGRNERKTISVSVYDKHLGQKTKKLCSLCSNCYTELLDYLGICDVEWSDKE